MTRLEVEEVKSGQRPLNKRVAFAMADALLAVFDAASEGPGENMGCPECGAKGSNSFALGWRTKARIVAARVGKIEMPA